MCSDHKTHCVITTLAGTIFVLSGASKFLEPLPAMAHLGTMIDDLSTTVKHNLVIGLSSIELLIGICMISRIFIRDSILMARSIAILFAVTVVYDAFRGATEGCGCFGPMKVMNTFIARVAATSILIFGTTMGHFSRITLNSIVFVVLMSAMGTSASAQNWGDYLESSKRREKSIRDALIEYVEASYTGDGAAFRVEYVRARLAPPRERWSRAIGASDLVDGWPGFDDACQSPHAFGAFDRALPSRVQVYDGSRMLVIDRGGAAARKRNAWSGRLTVGFDDSVRSGALNWWFLMWHRYPSEVLVTAVRVFERPRPNGCDFLVFFPRDEKNLLMVSVMAKGEALLPVRQVATIVPSASLESLGKSFVSGGVPGDSQGARFLYQLEVRSVSKGWSMPLPDSVEGRFAWAGGNRYRAWFRYRRDGVRPKRDFDVRSLPSEVAEGEDVVVLDELSGETREWRTGRTVVAGDLGRDQAGMAGAGSGKNGRPEPLPRGSTLLWAIMMSVFGALLLVFARRALHSRGG